MIAAENARPRVIIAEDEQVVAADLERSLADLGYDVITVVETGRNAIRSAGTEHPDIVLMDIQLRGTVDGIAAADEIVRRYQIPIVFITANINDEVLARARATSPYGYLIKPFRPKELNATLVLALHQHKRSLELFSEQAWLRTLLGSLSDGVVATDQDSRVRYLNSVAEEATGWRLAEAHGKPIGDIWLVTTLTGERVPQSQIARALDGAEPTPRERFLLHGRNGVKLPIEDFASPIREPQGQAGAVSVFHDISERLKQERKEEEERDLLEEQVQAAAEEVGETRAELRALSGHLISLQEEERRRLARELHDDFGQRTAVLEMQAARAIDLILVNPSEATDLLARMREQISALDTGLRNVSHRLHPSVIEDLGLIPALRSLVDELREAGSDVTLYMPESVDVSLVVATSLYRIVQEALRNAGKHAPGAPVHIRLSLEVHGIQLAIEDAGPGFDLNQVRVAGGLGLLNMQERARLLGGTFSVRARPGRGTTIVVSVPRITSASRV
jgi:PAS domain S-box-containing protein